MADKRIIERDLGYAILTAEGYTTIDKVVFAEEDDMNLLGVHTIEGFKVLATPTSPTEVGAVGDSIAQRFVAFSTVPCPANRPLTPPQRTP